MLKAMSVILMCGAAVPVLSQSATQYKVGKITAVQPHHNAASSNPSTESYDVSLRVDETTYVVLYTPPYGLQTVLYATGREFLVLVGEKTITLNDALGTSSELPIESQPAAETQNNPSTGVQSSSRPSVVAQSRMPAQCTEVIGLAGIKEKTEGTLTIDDGKLYFSHSGSKSQIPAAAMEDVVTGDDSERVIRGTLGTITMFGPYGSARVLSMFRSKIDSLTIQYRDDNGGLHGVIFTMTAGTAEAIKQELIAQGAHTSIPARASASVDSPHQVAVEGEQ